MLTWLVESGTAVRTLCFTRGEASTLAAADLGAVRAAELTEAARALGLGGTALLGYPDTGLQQLDIQVLSEVVVNEARAHAVDLFVAFDERGITGHPDHCRATEAALLAADLLGPAVLA